MTVDPDVVEGLRKHGISICCICGKPIVRMVKQPLGTTGKFRRVWSKAAYCSRACRAKAYRIQRKIKRLPKKRVKNAMADLTAKKQNFASSEIELMKQLRAVMNGLEQLDEEWTDLDFLNTITQDDLTGALSHLSPGDLANGIVAFRALKTVYDAQRVNISKLLP